MLNIQVKSVKYTTTVLFFLCVSSTTMADIAGRISTVVGQASITSGDTTRSVFKDDLIHSGEKIETLDNESKAQILFTDNSIVVLHPLSHLEIKKYFFDSNQIDLNASYFNLTKGSIRAISGEIAKHNAKNVQLDTPIGLVDVSQSDYNATLINNSLVLSVQQGVINFANKQGSTPISQGQTFQFFTEKTATATEAIALEPFITEKTIKKAPIATNGDKNRPRLEDFSNYKQFLQAMYLYRKAAEDKIKPRMIINNLPNGQTKLEGSTIEGEYDISYWSSDINKTMTALNTIIPSPLASDTTPSPMLHMNLLSALEMENTSINDALNQPSFLLSDILELNDDELAYLIKTNMLDDSEEQKKKDELLSYLLKKGIKTNAVGNDISIIGLEIGQPDITVIKHP